MEPIRTHRGRHGITRRRTLTLSGLAAAGATVSASAFPRRAGAVPRRSPAIFYAPHQDDETLGMAGAILQHKAAGRPVYLVLVTDGADDSLRRRMNDGACFLGKRCPAPGHTHSLGWEPGGHQVARARLAEFRVAASCLGVDRIYRMNINNDRCIGRSRSAADPDYEEFVGVLEDGFRQFALNFPDASHKFAAGWLDGNITHKACSDAAYRLRDEIEDMRFLHIYAYVQYPKEGRDRGQAEVLHLTDRWMARKRRALDSYKIWNPAKGLYALGYHSVPSWFDNSYDDPREFVYRLPGDYVTGKPARYRTAAASFMC